MLSKIFKKKSFRKIIHHKSDGNIEEKKCIISRRIINNPISMFKSLKRKGFSK